jgi:hypothetical protein
MADIRRKLGHDRVVVVYFRNLMEQKSMPGEAEIRAQLALQVLADETDGSILGATWPR